jgi:hypothetical protein
MYDIQHCFICRPLDSTVSEDSGIEPKTVATTALAVRRSITTRLDLILRILQHVTWFSLLWLAGARVVQFCSACMYITPLHTIMGNINECPAPDSNDYKLLITELAGWWPLISAQREFGNKNHDLVWPVVSISFPYIIYIHFECNADRQANTCIICVSSFASTKTNFQKCQRGNKAKHINY